MENFRIQQLEINHIGPFGELVLDFPEKPANAARKAEIHILTGENGTGKSTVLEALVASIGYDQLSRDKNRLNALMFAWSIKSIFSDNPIEKNELYTSTSKPNEYLLANYWQFVKGNLSNYKKFNVAFFAYSGHRRINNVQINGINDLDNSPFENALDFNKSVNPELLLQWIANTIAAEAIAQNQGNYKEANQHKSAIKRIEEVISKIIDKPISFVLATKPLKVQIKVDKELLDFNVLPDGLKSILSWLADLLMRMDRVAWVDDIPVLERNFILFLDEIEVHTHPSWQRKILPAVKELFPNAQIFISTHSPFVVGSVDGAWIHKLVKPNGDSHRSGPAVLSEDANSYRYWLNEIFDIKSEFGPQVQADLDEYYALRDDLLLQPNEEKIKQFKQFSHKLAIQGREMESIVSWETRQINKRLSLSETLAI
jgi:predicted ATP-binding protein involved in virulence